MAAAGGASPFIGAIRDEETNVVYSLIAVLGRGAYGAVYSATDAGRLPATLAIKKFVNYRLPLRGGGGDDDSSGSSLEDLEYDKTFVEHEYRVSEAIRRRCGEAFCRERVACALRRFFSRDGSLGYIVFPFAGSTLRDYLFAVQYAQMQQIERRKDRAGYDPQTTILDLLTTREKTVERVRADQTNERLRDRLYDLTDLLEDLLDFRDSIQLRGLTLAYQLANTFAILHRNRIFHRDIKPANLAVKIVGAGIVEIETRVLDFGLACVEDLAPPAVDPGMGDDRERLRCPETFTGTVTYRDPYSYVLIADGGAGSRIDANGRFDVYSVGKVFQAIFDPRAYDHRSRSRFPIVRPARYMVAGLPELIERMTGERGYRLPVFDAKLVHDGVLGPGTPELAFVKQITRDAERDSAYNRRPSMAAVVRELDRIITTWNDTGRDQTAKRRRK